MKRAFDLVVSATILIVLSPLLLGIAALIRVGLGSPVLFRQRRPGRYGRPFTLIKFRTMREAAGPGVADADRLTLLGRFLRASSLDELPELVNVVRGEMSLVGPRPLLMEYLPLYSKRHARRHEVRPGLTGLAQVSGRNALTWEEKFDLDIWYVDHEGPLLDAKILLRTLVHIVAPKGIAQPGSATAEPFTGYCDTPSRADGESTRSSSPSRHGARADEP